MAHTEDPMFSKQDEHSDNSYSWSDSLHAQGAETQGDSERGDETDKRSGQKPGGDSSGSDHEDRSKKGHRRRVTGRPKRSRKPSTGRGIFIGMAIVLVPLLVMISVFGFYLQSTGSRLMLYSASAQSSLDMSAIKSKLTMIQSVIDSTFLFDYDKDKLADSLYAGYVEGLDDPYTCYYSAEEYSKMMESSEGTYYGIGVMISQDTKTGKVYVIRVFSGSPAQEAGIQVGDVLMTVADQEVTGMDLNEVVAAIKGAEGTKVAIKVYRSSEKEGSRELTLKVERRSVDVDTVYYKMLDQQIGYLELTEFDSVSTDQFQAALKDLKEQGMKGMILDLRNNPGGLLDVAVSLADEFIDTGTVVSMKDKNGKEQVYKATQEGSLGLPLAVLVNGDSASASEVLSGCIKDYGAGTLVGTQTFGKGIVQNIIPFSDGTAMKVTTAHYYTPKGNDIHGVGIKPDVVVEDDTDTKDVDEQLQAAIKVVTDQYNE